MAEKVAVVLAAGKGTRMKTDLPKVLVPICGRPMIEHVLDALETAGVDRIVVVVGYKAELVRETLEGRKNITFVEQTEQLGTGHAVMVCREEIAGHHGLLGVFTGDCPMLQGDTVKKLFDHFEEAKLSCLLGSIKKDDPTGLGRIVRDDEGKFVGIVEHKDATEEQLKVNEVNMSYYVFDCQDLLGALDHLKTDNAQGEYYITDAPAILASQGKAVDALPVLKPIEALGVNTMDEAAICEKALEEIGKIA